MVESSLSELLLKDPQEEEEEVVEKSPCGRFLKYAREILKTPHKTISSALDTETGCEVSWYEYLLSPQCTEERTRLQGELSRLQSLSHPSLINWISYWFHIGTNRLIVITERLPDNSLKEYIAKIRSPRLKVIRLWAKQMLEALCYLHSIRPFPLILERLSLDSIYCVPSSGLVKLEALGKPLELCGGKVCGRDWEFAAPEVLRYEASPSMDIYSLGMCLLEICTQSVPYDECKTPVAKTRKVLSGHKPLSLARIQNDDVREFLELCLSPAEERPCAAQLLLHPFISDSSDTVSKCLILKAKHEGFALLESQNTIEIDMLLPSRYGTTHRRIEFPFNLNSDTPDGVAEEMVEELNLPQDMTPTISRKILSAVWEKVYESPGHESSLESLPDTKGSEGEEESVISDIPMPKHTLFDDFPPHFPLKHGFDNPSDTVKSLQTSLFHIYNTGGKIDGVFGKKTESLVKRFQEDFHMEVTGIVTREVWIRIRNESKRRESEL